MPIVYRKEVNQNVKLAVWRIEENVMELYPELFVDDQKDITDQLLENKKLEIIATRLLLKTLVENEGFKYAGITKDEHGKPYLNELKAFHISISHAFPYATAILDSSESTGIDIEAPREQIVRIKKKFLSDSELNSSDTIDQLTILWAAKECLYKIYGRKQVIFRQNLSVEFQGGHSLLGEIHIQDYTRSFNLRYEKIESHWLVYKNE